MKKIILLFALFFVSLHGYANYKCDAILTTENFQISCVLADVDESNIYYSDCQDPEETRKSISISNVRKLYLTNGTIVDFTKNPAPDVATIKSTIQQKQTKKVANISPSETSTVTNEQQSSTSVIPQPAVQPSSTTVVEKRTPDIIITREAKKIEANILEVSKTEIRYKENDNPEGPTFVLSTEDINSIIYSNGKITTYNQSEHKRNIEEFTPQNSTISKFEEPNKTIEYDLARVEQYQGVLVFTDCTPLAKYEIIGEIEYGTISGVIPQYTEIREGLISRAILANRHQVEGVIISMISTCMGKGIMIKFLDTMEDPHLSKVCMHDGIFVFTDNKPINAYTYMGKVDKAGGMNPNYEVIRDKFISKSKKKYHDANGIILRFAGGKDSAEAIKF